MNAKDSTQLLTLLKAIETLARATLRTVDVVRLQPPSAETQKMILFLDGQLEAYTNVADMIMLLLEEDTPTASMPEPVMVVPGVDGPAS